MPAVARREAEWTPDEARHLTECRSCQDEWELIQVTSRVGKDVHLSLEPAVTAEMVLQRLRREDVRVGPRLWTWGAVAAAVAFFAALWMNPLTAPSDQPRAARPVVAGLQFALPELESLQAAELDSVLQTMDDPAAGSTVEDPALGDLDSDELQRVLDSWEG
jgi:hypothetical protein